MGQVACVHDGHEYLSQHDFDGLGERRHPEGKILAYCQRPNQQNIYGCNHFRDLHLDSSGPQTLPLPKLLLPVIVHLIFIVLLNEKIRTRRGINMY